MTDLKPYILERKLLPKAWGGRRLRDALGIELPPDEAIGESWELFDRPDGSSPLRGTDQTLRDLMLGDTPGVLGKGVWPTPDGYFPLLLKYLDASEKLSVQVHPGDPREGKTEAWVVLGVYEGARIICGIKAGVSEEQLAAVAHTAEVEDLLEVISPDLGDAIFVPAGTVHSIGPGVVVFEVQQNSDTTYRLYDWGRPRETHVEQALSAVRLDLDPSVNAGTGGSTGEATGESTGESAGDHPETEWLFRNEFFTTRRLKLTSPVSLGSEGTFKVLSVIEGRGTIGWQSGGVEPPLLMQKGETVLVPAAVDVTFVSPIGGLTLLVCGPGVPK